MKKDVVRRILAVWYTPKPDPAGPSWLTVLGYAKDSLWRVDLFRCESAILRAHWVLVVMDQCTRGIVGFGVNRGGGWRGLVSHVQPSDTWPHATEVLEFGS